MVDSVGSRLYGLRVRARLSAKDLSLVAGLSASLVALIESNKRKGKGYLSLQRLSGALGASVGYLATGEGHPPTDAVLVRAVTAAVKKKNRELARTGEPLIEFLRESA